MARTIRGTAALAALGLAAGLAGTARAEGEDRAAALARAREAFERALAGDEAANERAAEAFARLSAADPQDPVALAYWGSATAVKARHAFWPWKKLALGEEGLDRIDRALRLLEKDGAGAIPAAARAETTLVAISTFLRMPDRHFHRVATGKRLLAEALAAPGFAALPEGLRAGFHEQAATAERLGG